MLYSSPWYLLIGFLLGNGMPHFLFGSAGKMFRTPFEKASSPRMNIGWGVFNFILASGLAWWRVSAHIPKPVDVLLLIAGFWLAVLMFGTSLKRFTSNKTIL